MNSKWINEMTKWRVETTILHKEPVWTLASLHYKLRILASFSFGSLDVIGNLEYYSDIRSLRTKRHYIILGGKAELRYGDKPIKESPEVEKVLMAAMECIHMKITLGVIGI